VFQFFNEAIKTKRAHFRSDKALVKAGRLSEANEAKRAYNEAKRLAKRVVWQAKLDAKKDKFANISPKDGSVFKLAKQMDRSKQDVMGEKCVKNDVGVLSLSQEEKMKTWVEHYARLLNVELKVMQKAPDRVFCQQPRV